MLTVLTGSALAELCVVSGVVSGNAPVSVALINAVIASGHGGGCWKCVGGAALV